MAGLAILVLGVIVVAGLLIAALKLPSKRLKGASTAAAAVVFLFTLLLSSTAYVGSDEVGVVEKHLFGANLSDGKIIAVDGQKGVQADVLAPGWHFGFWPVVYSVRSVPLTLVESSQVGLIEAVDGLPMEEGQLFAPEWPNAGFQLMLDAKHFLTDGKGRKGKQVSLLTPGKYRLNTELFRVRMVEQTEILQGEVGVLKANFGKPASVLIDRDGEDESGSPQLLAAEGEMGIRQAVLSPGKYPLNTEAYTLVEMWTTEMVANFAAFPAVTRESNMQRGQGENQGEQRQRVTASMAAETGQAKVLHAAPMEEREITVRTSDGFTFPVDVRIEYMVTEKDAPVVVAKLGDDEGDRFRNALNSAVRAIFRNNAEKVRALDYVQQRSQQESQSLQMLQHQMQRFGVTVTAVRIGNVGDEDTLGALLKTQTDRELAKQEQQTFQEQQKAAEQKKQLTKTMQESEEERKLATAVYSVKIAQETQKQKVAEAEGEAEAIKIKASAQAEAYKEISLQIGKSNAALIELLKIVGEKNIQITPRIMMNGGQGASDGGATTALVGTMLDAMMERAEEAEKKAQPK